MRNFLWLSLSVLLFSACEPRSPYQVQTESRVLIDDENCLIDQQYPRIIGISDSMTSMGINRYLGEALHLERELAACLEKEQEGRKVILAHYRLLSLSDSLISLEIIRSSKENSQSPTYKTYFPVTLQLPEVFAPPLDLVLGDTIYAKVLKEFKNWAAEDSSRSFNEQAFKRGGEYAIPFCLSADSLILYPGAEGESVAQNRLAIAWKDLWKS